MDFQTMLKKVKSKHYKSKCEFKDDLDLIWENCFTYNVSEVRRSSARSLEIKLSVCRTTHCDCEIGRAHV